MRLFVTGGAGYVGSIVTEHLLDAGHEVTVFDDLSTGHRTAVPTAATLVHGDLRDAEALRAALPHGCEAVLHFAARSIVADSVRDPFGYWQHNLGAALTLLQVMDEQRVRKLVFSSTAAVYGEPESQPIPETAALQPTNPYGSSKRGIEMLLEDAQRSRGLEAIALRYFNAAGASAARGEDHHPETHLLPRLLQAGLASEPQTVSIYGDDYPTPDGTCIRDYIHVEDLAAAHLAALVALGRGVRGAINLGTGKGHSVREILDCVRRVTGRKLPARVEPRRPGDPAQLVAGVQRASADLGWQAQRSLEDIVTSAWNWHRAHPRGYADGVSPGGANPSRV
jgi:UDP-glucose-4-epimerase GalE